MQSFLLHHGYLAVALLALIQSACIPIPSEVTFGFAGVLCASGRLSLAGVIVVGSIGEIVGSFVAYSVGRIGGRPLVERVGRYVLLTKADLDRAERFFDGRGELAVTVGRATPLIRAFVSLVAGIGEMAPVRFVIFGAVGTIAYVAALASIGYEVGQSWHHVAHDFSLAGYVIGAIIVVVVAVFIVHRVNTLRHEKSITAENAAS